MMPHPEPEAGVIAFPASRELLEALDTAASRHGQTGPEYARTLLHRYLVLVGLLPASPGHPDPHHRP